jgi:hypothetical protein
MCSQRVGHPPVDLARRRLELHGAEMTMLHQAHDFVWIDLAASHALLSAEEIDLHRLVRPEAESEILAQGGAVVVREEVDAGDRIGGFG